MQSKRQIVAQRVVVMDRQAKEQEDAFVKKYGNVQPHRALISKETKHFDSADWAMQLSKAIPSVTANHCAKLDDRDIEK